MQESKPEITAQDVIEIVQLFEKNAIEVYIDGGWGVDALEWMVRFHTGYAFDANDYCDVKALCEHFGISLPLEYEEFEKNCR
jgi:hypothetical protein